MTDTENRALIPASSGTPPESLIGQLVSLVHERHKVGAGLLAMNIAAAYIGHEQSHQQLGIAQDAHEKTLNVLTHLTAAKFLELYIPLSTERQPILPALAEEQTQETQPPSSLARRFRRGVRRIAESAKGEASLLWEFTTKSYRHETYTLVANDIEAEAIKLIEDMRITAERRSELDALAAHLATKLASTELPLGKIATRIMAENAKTISIQSIMKMFDASEDK